jgi:hypothetical protein
VEVRVVFLVAKRLSGLRVEFLPGKLADGAVELDVGRVELFLALFSKTIQPLDESGYFVPIQMPVVVVQFVELGGLLILRLVVAALDSPNVGPVGRGGRSVPNRS